MSGCVLTMILAAAAWAAAAPIARCAEPPQAVTWPERRLVAADGRTTADVNGYLALAQGRDGVIHLITSKDHYAFNLAWMKARPPAP